MRKRYPISAVLFWRQLFKKGFINIESNAFITLAFALLLVPYPWILGWGLSVAVHELGHLLALHFLSVPVISVRLGLAGAEINTIALNGREEVITAAAGPVAGLILTVLFIKSPYIACCAFTHSLFNLFPVYPMDGGRIFRIIVIRLLGGPIGERLCNLFNVLIPAITITGILFLYIIKLHV